MHCAAQTLFFLSLIQKADFQCDSADVHVSLHLTNSIETNGFNKNFHNHECDSLMMTELPLFLCIDITLSMVLDILACMIYI